MRWRWLEAVAIRYCDAFSRDSRPLTATERRQAREVFGPALDLGPIRIVRAYIVNSPVALGNVVRIAPGHELAPFTLIHELAHVWQYQVRGTEYISNSLWHQGAALIATGSRQAAYEVRPADLTAESIHDLPAEKQAVIVEGWFSRPSLRRHPDYRRLIAQVRAAKTS